MTTSALIGRDHPRAILRAEIDRTLHSHGGLVLVTGEAGIGKTTLVADALHDLRDGDALVVSGTAWDREEAPGYWPWVQVVRALRRAVTEEAWAEAIETTGEGLCFLLGDADLPRPDLTDASAFQLQDAVATLLTNVSRDRPVVVMLDDVHWADAASLKLLEFVVRHAWFEQILVIATYRDVDGAPPGHPLASLLARLAGKATTLTLTGLVPDQVRTLMARATGRDPDVELATEVHRRTGGNPFFVEQLTSLWHSGGPIEALPSGVREALETRLAQLPSAVRAALTTAAVIGREFEARVLAVATGNAQEELDTLLAQAVAARLVSNGDGGRYAFVHDLVRETLLASLPADTLRRQHAAIVTGLERCGPIGSTSVGDLAHHAYLAVPDIEAPRALELLLAAADDACARLAADEVASLNRRALELVPDDEPDRRSDIALDLGEAQRAAGDLTAARATFEHELQTGRRRGAPLQVARAVLGLHALGLPDPDQDWQREVELIDEAGAMLDEAGIAEDDPLRVRVLAASSRVRAHRATTGHHAEDRSARALALARRTGYDDVLGFSLLARHDAIWRPGTAPERADLADEMTLVARRTQDLGLELQASLLRMVALLEQGDPRSLDEHTAFRSLAERARLPRYQYLAGSRDGAIAALQGRFDAARAAIDGAFALGEQLEEVDRHRLWEEQRWCLCLLRGDFDEAEHWIGRFRTEQPTFAALPEAVTAAMKGETDLLVRRAQSLTAMAEDYPGMFRPSFLQAQAQVAAASQDPRLCEEAYAALSPFRDLWVVVAGGGRVHGPYAHWLALIDAAMQRWDPAIEGFTRAAEAAGRLDARPWVVEARLGLAQALRSRDEPGDREEAAAALADVVDEAAAMGMQHALGRANDAQGGRGADANGSTGTHPEQQPPRSAAAPPGNEFRPEGQVWALTFAGRTVRVPAAKGLGDLHVLLNQPGTDVAATDLLAPEGGQTMRTARRLGGDPILDEEARAAYRKRLAALDDDIHLAAARHDDDRAAELDEERAALLEELRRATGLGGRPRRLGDEAERARKTVTARIRDALRRLDEVHPELAEHLRASVHTGAWCRYQPAREVTWSL